MNQLALSALSVPVVARTAHSVLVERLNRSSVQKHFDAYDDVDWDAPEHRIDPEDPRFERPADSGLGRTAWYRALPAATRARLGLHIVVEQLRLGIDFESILSRGLLDFASVQAPGSPELRYAYHEVIEEGQHSLMFQELIARSGLPSRGLAPFERVAARRIPRLGRVFPELFFLHVLGGEAPIDHLQRVELARRDELHPLLRRVMQIHVTEEARHLSFARSFLREHAPRLSALRRVRLQIHTPLILATMARQMLEPPAWLLDRYAVPREVRRAAFQGDPVHRAHLADGVRPLRDLCVEIGLAPPSLVPLWRALGIWSDETPRRLTAGA